MAEPKSLYVSRRLLNAGSVIAWARAQGFASTLPARDMHVTVAFSRRPLDWDAVPPDRRRLEVEASAGRHVEPLGDRGALVLMFSAPELERRHEAFRAAGASWDHEGYRPHVTLTYSADGIDPREIIPYDGPLLFGPERFAEVDEGWADGIRERAVTKIFKAKVAKVDSGLGLVFGWAIICKEGGEPYFDSQDDHIPEDSMVKSTADFMANSRMAKVMHAGEQAGDIVFGFPMTTDIAKALEITTKRTGFLIAYKPSDPETLRKFESGEYTGFSIGGRVVEALDAA